MKSSVDHFNTLIDLIETEREAEKEENKRQLDRWPIEMRESLGKTVTGLFTERQDVGVGGLPLLVLHKPPANEELSPFHAMDQGDIVRVVFNDSGRATEGTLYDVEDYRVTVALNNELLEPPEGKCEIDLLGSDATYRRMKRALSIARDASGRLAQLRDVIREIIPASYHTLPEVDFFDTELNKYQKQAVKSALSAEDVALIHGPPGTGKTTVLVEIIRQAVKNNKKVLASAPSNVAVDNILEKLLGTSLKVVRMGHPARTLESLRHATLMAQIADHPDQKLIRDFDQERERLAVQRFRRQQRGILSREEHKEIQKEIRSLWKQARNIERSLSKEIIQAADVVLVTHGGMGRLLVNERFDLAVLDEASQTTEPLSWIPIIHSHKVVLAGDPLQLPPTIYSKEAAESGLKITLMEKLQNFLTDEGKTLLRIQYRMNDTIMGYSSQQFYEGKLEADKSVKNHKADELPDVKKTDLTSKSLIFIDTAGTGFEETWNELLDSRENDGEARLSLDLWECLKKTGLEKNQLAIITPYSAQSRLLKTLLPKGLEVGTVDGFQGREKEIIIVSLVRSNSKGEVGFLADTRRMNVAMTRARRLLIVIGDSATIGQNSFYSSFLDYVDKKGEHQSAWEWIKR